MQEIIQLTKLLLVNIACGGSGILSSLSIYVMRSSMEVFLIMLQSSHVHSPVLLEEIISVSHSLMGSFGKRSLQKQVDSNIVTLNLHKIPVQCSVRKLTLHQLLVDSSICCLILRQIPPSTGQTHITHLIHMHGAHGSNEKPVSEGSIR